MVHLFLNPKQVNIYVWDGCYQGEKHEITREYSISEYPKNNEYRITVRYIPGGKVSNYIHNNINVGDIVYSGPPCGDCVYESSLKI